MDPMGFASIKIQPMVTVQFPLCGLPWFGIKNPGAIAKLQRSSSTQSPGSN